MERQAAADLLTPEFAKMVEGALGHEKKFVLTVLLSDEDGVSVVSNASHPLLIELLQYALLQVAGSGSPDRTWTETPSKSN